MKKESFGKILAVLGMSAILVLGMTFSTYAYTEEDLNSVKDLIKEAQTDLAGASKKVQAKADEVKALEGKVAEKQGEVDKLTASIAEAEQKIKDQKEGLDARLRIMYKNGSIGYLDVILSSKSFDELISNLEMIKKIYKSDADVLEGLKKDKQKLEEDKAKLQTEAEALKKQEEELEGEQEELEKQEAVIQSEIQKLEEKQSAIAAEIARKYAEQEKAQGGGNTDENGNFVPPTPADGKYMWPTNSHTITSYYGYRSNPLPGVAPDFHDGLDIAGNYGDPIYAAMGGTVVYAQRDGTGSNTVMINVGGGVIHLYAHNQSINVSVGQQVSQGTVIARMGSTGWSTGPHCHFGIYYGMWGQTVDPLPYF